MQVLYFIFSYWRLFFIIFSLLVFALVYYLYLRRACDCLLYLDLSVSSSLHFHLYPSRINKLFSQSKRRSYVYSLSISAFRFVSLLPFLVINCYFPFTYFTVFTYGARIVYQTVSKHYVSSSFLLGSEDGSLY